ncbi:MAG: hypothetical protein U1E77_03020 [Inhella sp.]
MQRLLLLLLLAGTAQADTLCSHEREALRAHAGRYAADDLLATLTRTRRWDLAVQAPTGATELQITPQGEVLLSLRWHEAGRLEDEFGPGCLRFDGERVSLHMQHLGMPAHSRFTRVAGPQSALPAPYAERLLHGCYRSGQGARWCLQGERIEIDGQAHAVRLLLDPMELPEGGSVLEVTGQTDFWPLRPQGQGWAVHRTGWASAPGHRPPDWRRPWQVLRPE